MFARERAWNRGARCTRLHCNCSVCKGAQSRTFPRQAPGEQRHDLRMNLPPHESPALCPESAHSQPHHPDVASKHGARCECLQAPGQRPRPGHQARPGHVHFEHGLVPSPSLFSHFPFSVSLSPQDFLSQFFQRAFNARPQPPSPAGAVSRIECHLNAASHSMQRTLPGRRASH